MSNRETEPRSSYNDHFETVEISHEDKIIGAEIHRLFVEKFSRLPTWGIQKGVVTIGRTGEGIDGLENEQISPQLARVIAGFKRVEDRLPDLVRQGSNMTRNNMGLFEIHTQWAGEERHHGLGLGYILKQTGYKTEDQTIEEYQKNLERTFEFPFDTTRQIVAYSAFQERGTRVGYRALNTRAMKEGALKTARILRLIETDESFHGASYIEVMKIYNRIDSVGTIEDVLHVARNFRMPAENLHPNRLQWLRDLNEVDLLSRGLVAEGVVYHTLKGFGFIPEDVARKTADEFF